MIKKPIEDMTRDELATYARHLLSMIANLQAANAKLSKNAKGMAAGAAVPPLKSD